MTKRQEALAGMMEKERDRILAAERWLWSHPQTGYNEWEANRYMAAAFEEMGYSLTRADQDPSFGKIPGFYTEIDTGREGPCLCIMSELDALEMAGHPENVNGCAHACGHHAQGAAMLGLAAVLMEPAVLETLSGKIRLTVVPAEELIQLDQREKLREKGIITYYAGKTEFLHRGYLDGVDLAMMVHTSADPDHDFSCNLSANGCMAKVFTYRGQAAHAGGEPWNGRNAEYAMMLGLQACNNLRETFRDQESIRFHPILHGVSSAVNIIPDEMTAESYVRGKTLEAISRENEKINRALAGAALSMNCTLHLSDRPGLAPETHDQMLMDIAEECCSLLAGKNRVSFDRQRHGTASSDFGDITCVMPGIQFYASGASGTGHSTDYVITDPVKACVGSAKAQLLIADALLTDNASKAREVVRQYASPYPSIRAYLDSLKSLSLEADAVFYGDSHDARIRWA